MPLFTAGERIWTPTRRRAYIPPAVAGGGAWTPTSIAGCKLWLDGADAAQFAFSSGTLVSQWSDKSPAANHVIQATVGAQPTRNATQNGLSAVAFTGGSPAKYLYRVSGVTGLSAPASTALAVFKLDAGTAFYSRLLSLAEATGDETNRTGANSFDRDSFVSGIMGHCNGTVRGTRSLTMDAFHQGTCRWDGANNTVYANGTAGTPVAATEALAATRIAVGCSVDGASGALNGVIAEMILYDTALGTTDRQFVEAYLKAKWGTP